MELPLSVMVLDIQCFKLDKELIVKEFACTDGFSVKHVTFKPPFPFRCLRNGHAKRSVCWLEQKYHGLSWSSGNVKLCELRAILQRLSQIYEVLYVKGRQKQKFLQHFVPNVENIEDYYDDVPSLRNFTQIPACFDHDLEKCHCALRNVYMLHKYLMTKHYEKEKIVYDDESNNDNVNNRCNNDEPALDQYSTQDVTDFQHLYI